MYTYIYIYINTELLDGNQGHQEETHRPTHRFRRLFLDLLSMGWRGCASAVGVKVVYTLYSVANSSHLDKDTKNGDNKDCPGYSCGDVDN